MRKNPPALKFDPEFAKRPLLGQIDYLKKLCASQNQALDLMQKERNEWRDKAIVLEAQLLNAQQAFDTQKMIVAELITKTNADDQQTAQRIFDLEDRVRALDAEIEALNNGYKH